MTTFQTAALGVGLVLALLVPALALAQDAPPLPPDRPTGEVLEPEVRIIPREHDVIEEFRIGGRLYMIRVVPNRGLPYYLVDTDGDGVFDAHRHDLDNPTINQWLLHSW